MASVINEKEKKQQTGSLENLRLDVNVRLHNSTTRPGKALLKQNLTPTAKENTAKLQDLIVIASKPNAPSPWYEQHAKPKPVVDLSEKPSSSTAAAARGVAKGAATDKFQSSAKSQASPEPIDLTNDDSDNDECLMVLPKKIIDLSGPKSVAAKKRTAIGLANKLWISEPPRKRPKQQRLSLSFNTTTLTRRQNQARMKTSPSKLRQTTLTTTTATVHKKPVSMSSSLRVKASKKPLFFAASKKPSKHNTPPLAYFAACSKDVTQSKTPAAASAVASLPLSSHGIQATTATSSIVKTTGGGALLPEASQDFSSEESLQSLLLPPPQPAVYDLKQFKDMFVWAEEDFGEDIEGIEASKQGVRKANFTIDKRDSTSQEKAQYGRILPDGTEVIFDHLELNANTDVFLDVGHGIGNTVLQAAYVRQCDARGIEVIEARNVVAVALEMNLAGQRDLHGLKRDNLDYKVGEVTLVKGSLEAEEYREFLTQPPPGKVAIKAFCNNYNAVFADRSSKTKEKYHLDAYIAGLFAQMPPGSVLLTLHPLDLVALPHSEAQKKRREQGLSNGNNEQNASFYEMKVIELGPKKDFVSWSSGSSTEKLMGYKYTRVQQEAGRDEAVFLCCNCKCEKACNGEAIPATKLVVSVYRNYERSRVMNTCNCNAPGSMNLRERKAVGYQVRED